MENRDSTVNQRDLDLYLPTFLISLDEALYRQLSKLICLFWLVHSIVVPKQYRQSSSPLPAPPSPPLPPPQISLSVSSKERPRDDFLRIPSLPSHHLQSGFPQAKFPQLYIHTTSPTQPTHSLVFWFKLNRTSSIKKHVGIHGIHG